MPKKGRERNEAHTNTIGVNKINSEKKIIITFHTLL
jgi:hypothetical protein